MTPDELLEHKRKLREQKLHHKQQKAMARQLQQIHSGSRTSHKLDAMDAQSAHGDDSQLEKHQIFSYSTDISTTAPESHINPSCTLENHASNDSAINPASSSDRLPVDPFKRLSMLKSYCFQLRTEGLADTGIVCKNPIKKSKKKSSQKSSNQPKEDNLTLKSINWWLQSASKNVSNGSNDISHGANSKRKSKKSKSPQSGVTDLELLLGGKKWIVDLVCRQFNIYTNMHDSDSESDSDREMEDSLVVHGQDLDFSHNLVQKGVVESGSDKTNDGQMSIHKPHNQLVSFNSKFYMENMKIFNSYYHSHQSYLYHLTAYHDDSDNEVQRSVDTLDVLNMDPNTFPVSSVQNGTCECPRCAWRQSLVRNTVEKLYDTFLKSIEFDSGGASGGLKSAPLIIDPSGPSDTGEYLVRILDDCFGIKIVALSSLGDSNPAPPERQPIMGPIRELMELRRFESRLREDLIYAAEHDEPYDSNEDFDDCSDRFSSTSSLSSTTEEFHYILHLLHRLFTFTVSTVLERKILFSFRQMKASESMRSLLEELDREEEQKVIEEEKKKKKKKKKKVAGSQKQDSKPEIDEIKSPGVSLPADKKSSEENTSENDEDDSEMRMINTMMQSLNQKSTKNKATANTSQSNKSQASVEIKKAELKVEKLDSPRTRKVSSHSKEGKKHDGPSKVEIKAQKPLGSKKTDSHKISMNSGHRNPTPNTSNISDSKGAAIDISLLNSRFAPPQKNPSKFLKKKIPEEKQNYKFHGSSVEASVSTNPVKSLEHRQSHVTLENEKFNSQRTQPTPYKDTAVPRDSSTAQTSPTFFNRMENDRRSPVYMHQMNQPSLFSRTSPTPPEPPGLGKPESSNVLSLPNPTYFQPHTIAPVTTNTYTHNSATPIQNSLSPLKVSTNPGVIGSSRGLISGNILGQGSESPWLPLRSPRTIVDTASSVGFTLPTPTYNSANSILLGPISSQPGRSEHKSKKSSKVFK